MTLLALDDPVFVVDLTAEALAACREDFAPGGEPAPRHAPRDLPPVPDRPVRALALQLDADADPVLLAIAPTRDIHMLDALARLLRTALITGISTTALATEHGDEALRRMFFGRRFPAFFYEGFPPAPARRLPAALRRAVGRAPAPPLKPPRG